MKMRYMTKEEYIRTRRGYTKIQPILDEFIASGMEVAEIDITGTWKTARVAQSVIAAGIRRCGYGLETHAEGDKVYLIKKI